ncbi:DUF4082 domain-containing protein [Pelotalea chapellei]|uniref:Ig-like domain-containing protein n=1 Tax=Pelotalea chapellei TaxID=44671 RepID=A0ABS5U5A8_9BACT|nr:DUF4082 domain-containing protein [Pelotalea chapellei]MBT1070849.1 Ig-like domain-containing protein [Pelotalea chapellei]
MARLKMVVKQIVTALSIVTGLTTISPPEGFGASIWPSTTIPAVTDAGADSPVELGVKFRSDSGGTISAIRFYKSAANSGPHIVRLWSASGTLLATANSVSETASGWQQAEINPPVQVSANTVYIASYHTTNGHYSYNSNYFNGGGVDNPPLHAPADSISGVNGVFAYGPSGTFPVNGWQGTNYWVDVAFTASSSGGGGGTGGANIWPSTAVPAVVDGGVDDPVEVGVKFRSDSSGTISGIRFYKAAGNSGTHTVRLWNASGTLLATASSANETASGWQQADFSAPVAINANSVYTASYHTSNGHYSYSSNYFSSSGVDNPPLHALADGVSGVNGVFAYGSAGTFPVNGWKGTNYWVDVAFTASSSGGGVSGATIWPSSAVPAVVDAGADIPVEVGVKFRSDSSGTISGIRFYKSAANSGSHTVRLWNASGNLLATANSATETASGWQQADFSAPVAVSANTVYIASYHTSNGHYSYSPGFFNGSGVDNAPLHALANGDSGVNGVFAYGPAGTFPSGGWNGTNYWVDVAFTPSGVTPAGASIWPSTTVPSNIDSGPDNPVELGVKFRSDSSGSISGIRFYKAAANSGTHTARLWSAGGTLLATANFSNETASGWQQADFPSPVAIGANTVYVASYHTSTGHFSYNYNYFSGQGTDNPPLHALADGVSGANGVFAYGPAGSFPTSGVGKNYWVDVVFDAGTGGGDTLAPTVTTFTLPASSPTIAVAISALTASDNIAVTGYMVTESSTQPSASSSDWSVNVPTSYIFSSPGNKILYAWARDAAGNVSAGKSAPVTVSAPPSSGTILLISSASNPFSGYYAEILRTEGFNAFNQVDISSVSSATLAGHDLVILGEMTLTASQVNLFTTWVNGGGQLIAMRPDKKLASLLGLIDQASIISNGYLLVNTSAAPGAGITGQTMQYHGRADLYGLNGAASVATIYSSASSATSNPAVTLHSVGTNGGQAAAFTYDLASSVVYTRQGNPAWAGQERDGDAVIRSDDLFYGPASFDPQPNWIDLGKVAIPQADEQQRLLANLMIQMNMTKKPLPRFWYLPRSLPAAVIMTGDDHGDTTWGGTRGRFNSYQSISTPGCSVDNWECIRGTSYVFNTNPMTISQASALNNSGFEIGLHVNSNCANWTPSSLSSFYTNQLAGFSAKYPGLPSPVTNRTHCIAWSDYVSQAYVEQAHGIRLDTSYYYWPSQWIANNPGFFTGSGMPMRFADTDGTMIDVYQAASQMTDESGQSYPFTVDALLDRALGPDGFYGAFVVNAHTDVDASSVSDAVIDSARNRGIPVISSRQLLTWINGRNDSTFDGITWNGNTLGFTINAANGATGLTAMAPVPFGRTVTSVTRSGSSVPFSIAVVKGIQYASFAAANGSYQLNYSSDTASPQISDVTPPRDARDVELSSGVTATFTKPMNPATIHGNSFVLRGPSSAIVTATVEYISSTNTAILSPSSPLAAGSTYTVTITGEVRDLAGNSLGSSTVWSFTTAGFATSSATSIWPDTTVPATIDDGPDDPVELGFKFRSDKSGYITGIRFYKSAANTGTHVANLWSGDGTRLATATYNGESSSGWQQVNFPAPVAIAANTVYVASYHCNGGHYSVTSNYFKGRGTDTPPLHALADGISGSNGVYAYGSGSTFPNQGWNQSNYWVDVVFSETGQMIFGGSSFTGAPQAAEPVLTAIKVVPDRQRIAVGTSQQFSVTATYSDGSTKDVSDQVSWNSSEPGIATVTSTGLVTAHAPGISIVSATLNGVTGTTTTTATVGMARMVPAPYTMAADRI